VQPAGRESRELQVRVFEHQPHALEAAHSPQDVRLAQWSKHDIPSIVKPDRASEFESDKDSRLPSLEL
jgi:hypothetical protein